MALSDQDKKLLSHFLDGELSPAESNVAERLLGTEPLARDYLADQVVLQDVLQGSADVVDTQPKRSAQKGRATRQAGRRSRLRELPKKEDSKTPLFAWVMAAAVFIGVGLVFVFSSGDNRSPGSGVVKKPEKDATLQEPPKKLVQKHPKEKQSPDNEKKSPGLVEPTRKSNPDQNGSTSPKEQNPSPPEVELPDTKVVQKTQPVLKPEIIPPQLDDKFASVAGLLGTVKVARDGELVKLAIESALKVGDRLFSEADAAIDCVFESGVHMELAGAFGIRLLGPSRFELTNGALHLYHPQDKNSEKYQIRLSSPKQVVELAPGKFDLHIFASSPRVGLSRHVASYALHLWSGKAFVADADIPQSLVAEQSFQRSCTVDALGKSLSLKSLLVDSNADGKPVKDSRLTLGWGNPVRSAKFTSNRLERLSPGDHLLYGDLIAQRDVLKARPKLDLECTSKLAKKGALPTGFNVIQLVGTQSKFLVQGSDGKVVAAGDPKKILAAIPGEVRARATRFMQLSAKGNQEAKESYRMVKLDSDFISKIVNTAVYLDPRLPKKILKFKHPIQLSNSGLMSFFGQMLKQPVLHDVSGYHLKLRYKNHKRPK